MRNQRARPVVRVADRGRVLILRVTTATRNRRGAVLFAAGMALVALPVLVAVCSFGPIDLEVYRFGAQALVSGGDLYGVLPVTRSGTSLPFIYPPFAAILFVPLAIPPLPVAAIALTGLTLVSLAAALYTVIRRVWVSAAPRTAGVVAIAATAFALMLEPVRQTLSYGQINMVLMALVVVDCLTEKPRWRRGMLVGIAAAIKITPAAFLLFFLLRKDSRAARTAVLTAVAASLLGFVMAPGASLTYWFGGELTGASGLSASPYATNQTIAGALTRLHFPLVLDRLIWWTLASLVLVAAALIIRRAGAPMALMANAAAALVLSPISWSHHWVWIAPAIVVFAAYNQRHGVTAALAMVFVVAPHSWLPSSGDRELAWTPWQHVVGNTYLVLALGALAWFAVTSRRKPHLTDYARPPGGQPATAAISG